MGTNVIDERRRHIMVTTRDAVSATVYEPADAPRGLILVHSATATPQGFYRAFAQYAAAAGFAVLTYDYRGTGRSGAPKNHRKTRMRDWIQTDVPAVAAWARREYPEVPHFAVGHSVGGHAIALNYGTEAVNGAVIAASHIAAVRTIESRLERLRVRLILNVIGPVLCRVLGYMPGAKLSLGEDIPSAALLEWSRWTRMENYFLDDPTMNAAERTGSTRLPILAAGADDDPWASPKQMDRLANLLHRCQITRRTIKADELGVSSIGHHGLMRRGVGEKFWDQILEFFTRCPQHSPRDQRR